MKAYKGFFKDEYGRMYCQPFSSKHKFYYEEGKTYTLPEGKVPCLCYTGFHACKIPMDVFDYYNSGYGNVEFHEVELDGVSNEHGIDSKVVGGNITIGRKITPEEMLSESVRMMLADKEKYFMGGAYIIVKKDDKRNIIDTEGKLLSEEWYDYCGKFHNGFCPVRNGKKFNYINKDGKIIGETWFDDVKPFHYGHAAVCLNGKWKHIGINGNLLQET